MRTQRRQQSVKCKQIERRCIDEEQENEKLTRSPLEGAKEIHDQREWDDLNRKQWQIGNDPGQGHCRWSVKGELLVPSNDCATTHSGTKLCEGKPPIE
jgi:hypothetical protein